MSLKRVFNLNESNDGDYPSGGETKCKKDSNDGNDLGASGSIGPCNMCEHCGSTFRQKFNLLKHIRKVHSIDTQRSNVCDTCVTHFKCRKDLLNHIRHTHKKASPIRPILIKSAINDNLDADLPRDPRVDLLLPSYEITGIKTRVESVNFDPLASDDTRTGTGICPPCTVNIRVLTSSDEDLQTWLDLFCNHTKTNYIVDYSHLKCPTGRKLSYSKRFICQMSSLNKSACSKRDLECRATVHMRLHVKPVQCSMKRNVNAYEGYLGHITIDWRHSHPIANANVLTTLRMSDSAKSTAHRLFQEGVSAAGVKQIMQDGLFEYEDDMLNYTEQFYDRHHNPSYRQISHLFTKWREQNCGIDEASMIVALNKRTDELREKGFYITSHADDPLLICLTSPIMRRASKLPCASEIVFVDTTSTVDGQGISVTFMLTATAAGAVPLCVLLHAGQSEEVYNKVFSLAKNVISQPACFMTDDSLAERNALHANFPESNLLLCIFHRAQATWRWLSDGKNNIPRECRQELMAQYSHLMRAQSEVQAEDSMRELRSRLTKYPKYLEYIEKQWLDRKCWVLGFRRDFPTRGNNTNNYAEATIRVVKDIILCRQKSFNLIAFVVYFSDGFERYLRSRIMNTACPTSNKKSIRHKAAIERSQTIDDDNITELSDGQFTVHSQTSGNRYSVDVVRGFCECYVGCCGACCKHQLAVAQKQGILLPNIPVISTPHQKHSLSVLALGDKAPRLGFFTSPNAECDADDFVSNEEAMETSLHNDEAGQIVSHEMKTSEFDAVESDATRLEELDEFDISLRDRTVQTLSRILEQVKGINSADDPMLAAIRRLDGACKGRATGVETVYSWCANAKSTRLRRVIRTQPTAAGRRKSLYKGGRSLTRSRVREHKLSRIIRDNVASAKKH